jgi:molybdopterin-guanine dinucleotide biosynthesis protein A
MEQSMSASLGVSGIVLAGGMSRRLGRNKAVEPLGGDLLIARVIGRLSQVSEQTVVVVNDRQRASELPLPDSASVVVDAYPGKGSLGGIFTGLSAADTDWGIVVACDMPFLNVDLLKHMLSIRDGLDAVVPVVGGRPEPTHAVYSKVCLPHIRRRLEADDLKIARFFDDVRTRLVPEEDIDLLDPEHLSFFNVNTQEDLDRAQALVAQGY